MYIVGFESNKAVPYAIKLGVALQMSNILRDVGEDYRSGRIYLPRDEMIFYGIHESDFAEGRVTKNWRQFMRFQIQRTRDLYEESWLGIRLLEPEGRLAIGAASVLYSGILDEIERNDYDVFFKRASLSPWEKLKRVPALWLNVRSL
jgi:phytoene synthase